jgi:hypothetical protein
MAHRAFMLAVTSAAEALSVVMLLAVASDPRAHNSLMTGSLSRTAGTRSVRLVRIGAAAAADTAP